MASEAEFDRLGEWLLDRKLSIRIALADAGHRPFRIFLLSRCIGQGATLSEALREAGFPEGEAGNDG